jgi:hypothetical protein
MDFRIVDIFELDGYMTVPVEMYQNDLFWHSEHFQWEGEEGLRYKRKVSASGKLLLDDGSTAPIRDEDADYPVQYLPVGREWARYTDPRMTDESILGKIREIHAERMVTGFPQGTADILPRPSVPVRQRNRDGCSILVAKFQHLVGYSE